MDPRHLRTLLKRQGRSKPQQRRHKHNNCAYKDQLFRSPGHLQVPFSCQSPQILWQKFRNHFPSGCIRWQVLSPPPQASSVHLQMIETLKSLLDRHRHWDHHSDAILMFVVNVVIVKHLKMIHVLKFLLDRQRLVLEQSNEGPCLLTVVNSSRLESDYKRDSQCLKGVHFGSIFTQPRDIPRIHFGDFSTLGSVLEYT